MRYVLDASVALKWVLNEPGAERALFLRKEFELLGVTELIAPDILPIEIAHALAKATRQGKLSAREADTHLTDISTTLPQLVSSTTLLDAAFRIAQLNRIAVYDSLYIALSVAENTPLVTADKKLVKLPYLIVDIDGLPYPPP